MTPEASSPSGFDSQDSIVVVIDGPIDAAVRPCRPSLRAALQAESEKVARYRAMLRGKRPENGDPGRHVSE